MDMSVLEKARDFAKLKHEKQKDDAGLNYFETHLQVVVDILANVTDDENILAAGYLHDTVEDTETTYEELVKEFGKTIANLVMEVTHDGEKDKYGRYFPRLKSKEGILIKFADRLSNLSRMDVWDDKRKAQYLKKSKFWKTDPTQEGVDLTVKLINHLKWQYDSSCKCDGYVPGCMNCDYQVLLGHLENKVSLYEWELDQEENNVK